MTDVRIVSVATLKETIADWLLLPDGDLDDTEELATLAKVCLMTDRLAREDEPLPDPDSDDRRGWWGDYQADVIWGGWPIGTKNWLLTRSAITDTASFEGGTLARAENYTREALAPLIQMKVCSRIDVRAERIGIERIDVNVTIYRGPKNAIQLRFQDLWNEVIA